MTVHFGNLSEMLGLTRPQTKHHLKALGQDEALANLVVFQCRNCSRIVTFDRKTWYEMVVNGHNPFKLPKHLSLSQQAQVQRIRAAAVCPNPRRTS